ncbi:uncharacterized protein LOC113111781 [Carassius auratus]|uniref:Uncharacterized protein LOC113111781 n=1 Tax=Carassius auratus TaxID=7957 RepID=A0A6P6QIB7_CARAU|nr:uncharacterized protein LOC113111781 [Carassius auratus]
MVRILNNVFDLKETRFGQPRPRHGLSLLWWFAHDCVQIDSDRDCMTAQCDPANGEFGFHRFYNKERLLPKINLPYYEVGNLSTPGSLPLYVTRHYNRQLDSSNKDRIIVSFDSIWKRFEKIYVTQHSNQVRFDQKHTFCISIDLLRSIQALSLNDFYREPTNGSGPVSISKPKSVRTYTFQSRPTGNELMKNIQESSRIHFHREPNGSGHVSISRPQSVPDEPQSVQDNETNSCQSICCAVLICFIVLMLVAAAVYAFFKMI